MKASMLLGFLCHLIAVQATPQRHGYNRSATSEVTFTNTRRLLFDTDGSQVDAYGSKINLFAGKYYLYGNSFSQQPAAFGIKSYSSVDLINWHYEGYLFNPNGTNPCAGSGGCGRPHIVYNPASSLYVLWANAGASGYAIATSSDPAGPFTFKSSNAMIDPQFDSLMPADFAVETFGSKGYLVFSALNFEDPSAGSIWPPISQTLHISPLTPDFQNTTGISYPVASSDFDLIDQETESPDIFMRNGEFYIAASNTCGYCNASIGLLYRAKEIQGPWERQIISGFSCSGQVEGVLPLHNSKTGEVTYVWHSTSVPGGPRTGFGGHIFQPLEFTRSGDACELDCSPSACFPVTFDTGSDSTANTTGAATEATDYSPALADYTPVCDSDQWTLFQTWTSSKSGTLKSVSINVAASVQTTPLTLTVFRYSNDIALTRPGYKYETLATASVPRSALTYVFDAYTLDLVNVTTVSKGDRLGLSIAGADFAPYCHLEYDTAGTECEHTSLFQQGSSQNSWRGLHGDVSPVYVRPGKGLKFFATVE